VEVARWNGSTKMQVASSSGNPASRWLVMILMSGLTRESAGYDTGQCPYDTFWGARYAIVGDQYGQHVGIMSSSEGSPH
jgi:hypothetical protein